MNEGARPLFDCAPHLLVNDLARLAREAKDFFKAVGMEARLERHKRYFPRPWHDRNREVGNVVFFQSGQVEQRLRRMDAGRDSADKIKERNAGGDERKRGRVDRCAEKAAILLNLAEISTRDRG